LIILSLNFVSLLTKKQQKMGLKLKHIQHYQALKVKFNNGTIDIITSIDFCDNIVSFLNENSRLLSGKDDFKLLLIPLSSITNNQLKEFYQLTSIDLELVDIEEWKEELVNMIKCNDKFKLSQFQKLFEWHFDVFGLIDKGLALPKE